jgi:hypothetical protein
MPARLAIRHSIRSESQDRFQLRPIRVARGSDRGWRKRFCLVAKSHDRFHPRNDRSSS